MKHVIDVMRDALEAPFRRREPRLAPVPIPVLAPTRHPIPDTRGGRDG